MNITPLSPVFGAEIDGVDLSSIGDADFEEVYRAWVEYGVLRFRGQKLDDGQLEAFSARFGPLEKLPMRLTPEQEKRIPSLYVVPLSNITVDGKPIGGLSNSEANWHSDMTYEETPPPASVLLSVEIPAEGGDTQFCCQHAALEAMPESLRVRLTDLRIKHDASLPQNVWAQKWNVGDVVIWDNRRVLHRRDAFPNHMRRMMRRCQVLARE